MTSFGNLDRDSSSRSINEPSNLNCKDVEYTPEEKLQSQSTSTVMWLANFE